MYHYGARYYDPRISIFVSVDPLAEQTMEPYLYTGNNPIMFTDPTGMSKEGGGDPTDPPTVMEETTLPEMVIEVKNWFQENFSKDKLKSDVSRAAENTGFNHAVKESIKIYNSINKLGAYVIWGSGSEEMGRNEIKIKGEHKHIDASNIPMPGLGGIETKANTIPNLVQYLTNSFGVFNSMSEVKSDSVFQTIGTDPGSGFIIYKTNNRNDAQKQKEKMEKNGALYIQINATKK